MSKSISSINVATLSALFPVSETTTKKLDAESAAKAAKRELDARRAPQTVQSLEKTFPGISAYMDCLITAKFVQMKVDGKSVVDGDKYLTIDGTPTSDEDEGDSMNPNYMKVVCDGRTAWNALPIVNQEVYYVTNSVWNSRDKKGTLTLPGFNDSDDAIHGNKPFTVTEAGALATLVFGTREDRTTGLYFKHFLTSDIRSQHYAYLDTPEAKAVAEKAKAKRAAREARREEAQTYSQYKASVPEVSTPLIPADAGLKVAKDGTIRKGGKFVKKNTVLA